MPEVSVIIPTCRRPDKVHSTIKSVVNQTFTDLEIIVVNDDEDDKPVKDLIDTLRDKRIHYFRNQRKKGPNGARNTGFDKANGRYIAFLDDDDIWYPHKIQRQMRKFNQSSDEVGFVYSGFEIISNIEPEISRKIYPQKKGKVLIDIINGNFVGSPTPLIRKDILQQTGLYDENLESAQDWDLWIRIADKTEFEYVDEILARYVVHGDQISVNLDKKLRSMDYIIKKYDTLYRNNKKALANMYKKTAVLSLMNGKIGDCRRRIIKGLTVESLRLDLPSHLLLSLMPPVYKLYIDKYIAKTYSGIKFVH
jgi:glycosyltransferase involved in cell wall biosynthesis